MSSPPSLAFSIAYILDPVVDWLETWHVPRFAGIALVLGGTLGTVGLFLVLVLPGIATDVAGVIWELPMQLAALWTAIAPWLEQRGIAVRIPDGVGRGLNALASEVGSEPAAVGSVAAPSSRDAERAWLGCCRTSGGSARGIPARL